MKGIGFVNSEVIEEIDLEVAAISLNNIQFIENPSEAVQLAAVQQNGYAIAYIANPSEAVKLAAVQRHSGAVGFIENPSEAVQLAAVRRDGYALGYITNPSEAVQLAAIRKNSEAFWIIDNPSEKVTVEWVGIDLKIDGEFSRENVIRWMSKNRYDDINRRPPHRIPLSYAEEEARLLLEVWPEMAVYLSYPNHDEKLAAITKEPDMIDFFDHVTEEMEGLAGTLRAA